MLPCLTPAISSSNNLMLMEVVESTTEFLRGVMPKDLTANSWHDKRREEERRARKKALKVYKRRNRKLKALRPAPPNSKKRRSPRARRHRSKEDSVGRAAYVTKGAQSPRVAVLNRYGDIVQTNLPVIPNQRWVQVNPLAKG